MGQFEFCITKKLAQNFNACLIPSSVVVHISYNAVTSTLRVRFVSGMLYEYKKVPEKVFLAMKSSDSKGAYLNRNIKGHYDFKKIE